MGEVNSDEIKEEELVKADDWDRKWKAEMAWAEKHPVLSFLKGIRYWPCRVRDTYYNWKHGFLGFFERGAKGYARHDLWGFDYYLAKMIRNAARDLKRIKHGVPVAFVREPEPFQDSVKRWDTILDQLIEGFDLIVKMEDEDLIYPHTNWGDIEKAKKRGLKFLTEEQVKKVDKAFELIGNKDVFYGLND